MNAEKGDQARFLISKKDLSRFGDWTPLARQYLNSLGDSLDLEAFLREYREKVRTFQTWFVVQLRHHSPETLANYLETRRTLNAIGAKTWWNILLTQIVIQAGRDAYDYLDRFLDPAELERVYALPFRSKEQVNLIITLVDEYGACDETLRETAYRAFKVSPPNHPAVPPTPAATTTNEKT
jgi:hypothetical protein